MTHEDNNYEVGSGFYFCVLRSNLWNAQSARSGLEPLSCIISLVNGAFKMTTNYPRLVAGHGMKGNLVFRLGRMLLILRKIPA